MSGARARHLIAWLAAVAVAVTALTGTTAAAQDAPWTIRTDGLGPIRIGLPIDAVRDVLPDGYSMSDVVPLAPDIDGHVISFDETVQALIPATPSARVDTIIVLSPDFATPEGIGPESLVGDAEDVYGDAALTWDDTDQGRERVEFDRAPKGLSFRTSESVGPQAGVYAAGRTSTVLFLPDAQLSSIWILAGEGETENADVGTDAVDAGEPAEDTESTDTDDTSDSAETAGSAEPADGSLASTGVNARVLAAAGVALLALGRGVSRTGAAVRSHVT